MGTQMTGKTLGIIGLGKVGSQVARKLPRLDMADDGLLSSSAARRPTASPSPPGRLVEPADTSPSMCRLPPSRASTIGARDIARMKPGAFLVERRRRGRSGGGRHRWLIDACRRWPPGRRRPLTFRQRAARLAPIARPAEYRSHPAPGRHDPRVHARQRRRSRRGSGRSHLLETDPAQRFSIPKRSAPWPLARARPTNYSTPGSASRHRRARLRQHPHPHRGRRRTGRACAAAATNCRRPDRRRDGRARAPRLRLRRRAWTASARRAPR